MANCRGCGKEIPDGYEYCEDCLAQLNIAEGEAGLFEKEEGSPVAVSETADSAGFPDYNDEDIPEFGAEEDIPEFGADLPKFDEGEEDIPVFGESLPRFDTGEEFPAFGEETRTENVNSEADSTEDDGLDALLDSIGQGAKTEASQLFEDGPTGEELLAAASFDEDIAELLSGFGEEFGNPVSGEEKEPSKEEAAGKAASESAAKETVSEFGEEKKQKKQKKEKKAKTEAGGKKPGRFSVLWHKLFDNVKVDPSKIKPKPTPEEIAAKKKAAEEAKEKEKAKKEAEAAEKKNAAKKQKEEKQRRAKAIKEEKKARKLEEAKLLLEEMETTRINRAGASIVFIFFAMIAVVVIVGTNLFSYSLSIRNAEYEFNRDEYTAAYNEIFGLDVKDEDIVLYDRIMTVMYVQKQLNSYYNYYEMKDYPHALDSLLKGLQRYEKYIELAIELGIETDLDSVRNSILAQAEESFQITEWEAMEIIQSKSRLEYSNKVYKAVEKVKE